MSGNEFGFQTFRISVPAATEQHKAIKLEMEALAHNIDRLIERTKVQGDNSGFIAAILNVTRDRSELKQLARSLDRVADHVARYDELARHDQFLHLLMEQPETVAALAGDFSDEMDFSVGDGEVATDDPSD